MGEKLWEGIPLEAALESVGPGWSDIIRAVYTLLDEDSCAIPCSEGEHDIAATYQNYGYWHGQCSKCKKEWEVDSSG